MVQKRNQEVLAAGGQVAAANVNETESVEQAEPRSTEAQHPPRRTSAFVGGGQVVAKSGSNSRANGSCRVIRMVAAIRAAPASSERVRIIRSNAKRSESAEE